MGKHDLYDFQDEGDYSSFDHEPAGVKAMAFIGLCLLAWAILGLAAFGAWKLVHG